MERERWKDVPGDLIDEDPNNLPGGFGAYNPDLDVDAMVDEVTENDIVTPQGEIIGPRDQRGGVTAGTSYAEAEQSGSTVDPADLGPATGEGEPEAERYADRLEPQQRRNQSVESEGPFGDQE